MIPVFFILAILLVLWIRYEKNKSDRAISQATEAFWEKESRANLTRKQDISGLSYLTVPLACLPLHEITDTETAELENKLRDLAAKKIVNFTGITNTELKLMYGAPNITLLMEFDQNYLELVRTLNRYGKLLYDHGERDAAKTVLEYGIEIGTDISANYTLLAEIYKEENNLSGIDSVIARAGTGNSLTKTSLLARLAQLKAEATGTDPGESTPGTSDS